MMHVIGLQQLVSCDHRQAIEDWTKWVIGILPLIYARLPKAHRISDDRQRKNPEIQDARNHVRRTEPERSGYGMMGLIIDWRRAC